MSFFFFFYTNRQTNKYVISAPECFWILLCVICKIVLSNYNYDNHNNAFYKEFRKNKKTFALCCFGSELPVVWPVWVFSPRWMIRTCSWRRTWSISTWRWNSWFFFFFLWFSSLLVCFLSLISASNRLSLNLLNLQCSITAVIVIKVLKGARLLQISRQVAELVLHSARRKVNV